MLAHALGMTVRPEPDTSEVNTKLQLRQTSGALLPLPPTQRDLEYHVVDQPAGFGDGPARSTFNSPAT
jgi:hypothetical protein